MATTQPIRPPGQSSGQPEPPARPANGQVSSTAAQRYQGKASAAQISLPERPILAPGVHLAGQMHESAFEDPPWLIERETR